MSNLKRYKCRVRSIYPWKDMYYYDVEFSSVKQPQKGDFVSKFTDKLKDAEIIWAKEIKK